MTFDIKSIAIVGGGPSGISSLTELLNTSKSGVSTINKPNPPQDPSFDKIVLFEQNSEIGGVWNHSGTKDPIFPSQDILDTGNYNDPYYIRPVSDIPEGVQHSSIESPVTIRGKFDKTIAWKNSAVYEHLFTNVPQKYLSFSYHKPQQYKDNKEFRPFATHKEIKKYLNEIVTLKKLEKHIRVNSTVERIVKDNDNKWHITISKHNRGTNTEEWYTEKFDAVIIASGQDNIPYIPNIANLDIFNKVNPGILQHTKSYQNSKFVKNRKVLLVGGSVSSADILQYLIPVASEVHVSRTSVEKDIWFARCFDSDKIINHGAIKQFLPDSKGVEFDDGTIQSDFDYVLFATGYHIHYPYLSAKDQDNLLNVTSGSSSNDRYARKKVNNSYLYTFSINDPTFANVGLPHNLFKFVSIEASSIAIAGVWSNVSHLPSREDQLVWIKNRIEGRVKGFQYDAVTDVAESLLNLLVSLGLKDRSEFFKDGDPHEVLENQKLLNGVFDKFGSGEFPEEYGTI